VNRSYVNFYRRREVHRARRRNVDASERCGCENPSRAADSEPGSHDCNAGRAFFCLTESDVGSSQGMATGLGGLFLQQGGESERQRHPKSRPLSSGVPSEYRM
jgi:hypothetical protein